MEITQLIATGLRKGWFTVLWNWNTCLFCKNSVNVQSTDVVKLDMIKEKYLTIYFSQVEITGGNGWHKKLWGLHPLMLSCKNLCVFWMLRAAQIIGFHVKLIGRNPGAHNLYLMNSWYFLDLKLKEGGTIAFKARASYLWNFLILREVWMTHSLFWSFHFSCSVVCPDYVLMLMAIDSICEKCFCSWVFGFVFFLHSPFFIKSLQ